MNVLRRGFELLQTRPLHDQLVVEALEEKFSLLIPPKYRLFATLFYLRIKDQGDKLPQNEFLSQLKYLPSANAVGADIFFDNIFALDFSMSTYRDYEFWSSKGYMQIGDGPPEGGILLDVDGVEKDSIIYNSGHTYFKLADNIFDFFREVVIQEVPPEQLPPSLSLENVYKNWGEGFWRTRD